MPKFRFYALWLSLICIAVFVMQKLISGFTEIFVLNKDAIYNYEIWRFLTAIFLHGSVSHLIYNLFALLLFGLMLEKLIGGRNFLIVFFFSGIIANIVSVNFYASSFGVSGAIMGIIGCLALIRPLMMVWAFGILMPMFIAAIVWIIGDVFGLFIPSNVGHIAHLSGIGVGILFGVVFRILMKRRTKKIELTRIKIPEDYMHAWERHYMR